uniref:Uncharacterized protein n=1 Tax=Cannabis sativa TaxID=3483 RepID=A0A803QYL6_CANSA
MHYLWLQSDQQPILPSTSSIHEESNKTSRTPGTSPPQPLLRKGAIETLIPSLLNLHLRESSC